MRRVVVLQLLVAGTLRVPDGIASARPCLFLPCAVIIFAGRPAAFGTLVISSPMA
jgi:hypothetical protein